MHTKKFLRTVFGVVALSVGVAAPAAAHEETSKIEVEGKVESVAGKCPSLTVSVGSAKVMVDDETRFDDGTCADLTKGKSVEIHVAMKDDKMKATSVDFDA